jgi:hypothetical protein
MKIGIQKLLFSTKFGPSALVIASLMCFTQCTCDDKATEENVSSVDTQETPVEPSEISEPSFDESAAVPAEGTEMTEENMEDVTSCNIAGDPLQWMTALCMQRHSSDVVENPEVNTCVQEMVADPALLEARDACELMGTLKRQWCVAKGTAESAVEDCVTASDNLPATVRTP